MKETLILLAWHCLLTLVLLPTADANDNGITQIRQREVAITFDDLPGVQMGGTGCGFRTLEALNRKLIDGIVSHRIPALGGCTTNL